MTSGWADFMGRVLQALTRRVEMGTAAKDWKHKRGRRFCGNERFLNKLVPNGHPRLIR